MPSSRRPSVSLSRRPVTLLAVIIVAALLAVLASTGRHWGAPGSDAAIIPAQAAHPTPAPAKLSPQQQAPAKARLPLVDGQALLFTTPQFKVEALWFKANDETGWYWTGSDEVYAVFSDMDPTHTDRTTSTYGDVDEGETHNFKASDSCMAPQPDCVKGMADLNVRFSFWESDWAAPLGFSYCNPADTPGRRWRVDVGVCVDDDFIGRGSIIYSRDELVAMLPAVGDSQEFTAVMDKDAGKYRFRYRITRLPNAERSIVIHLPPDILTTISLQATVTPIGGGKSLVTLSWSGATGSSVDLYQDGVKLVTTSNDGTETISGVVAGTYQYRLCELNSTTVCSPAVTVVVS
jgi:hypothetical protein